MDIHNSLKQILVAAFSGGVVALILTFGVLYSYGMISSSPMQENATSLMPTSGSSVGVPVTNQEDAVVASVEKANSAVVSIIVSKEQPVLEQYYEDYGYLRIPRYRTKGTEKREVGGGSGFIVSGDGYLVTNKHVVEDPTAQYTVFLDDKTEYNAKVVARDPLYDIAVLKIEANNLPMLAFGDSNTLKVGQTVIAIGNPLLEFTNSVSVGVVSGLERSVVAGGLNLGGTEHLEGVIQTDAAINPGNSGGPLLNLRGQVVGMNVAVANAENIGFSIPANLVKNAFDSVKQSGKISRPFLGVRYTAINKEVQEAMDLSVDYGVLITKGDATTESAVVPRSPAEKAGLVEGDIILEIDGKKLAETLSLAQVIASKKVGDTMRLKVLKGGKDDEEMVVELEEIAESS